MNNVSNKSIKILLIIFLLTISITHIYATDSETKKGVVNSNNGVNFRAGAGTTYDISSKKGFDREKIFTDIASGLVEKFTQSMKNIKDYHIDSIVLKAQKNNEVNKCC